MNIRSFGYIGLVSTAAEAWREFGPRLLGTPVAEGGDGAVLLRCDERHHRIAVRAGAASGLDYLGWEMADGEALAAAARALAAAGIAAEPGDAALCRARRVDALVAFTDAHGYRHELFHRPAVGAGYFRAEGGVSGFAGLGHAFVFVRDVVKAERHYRDLFGFRVSDCIDFGMGASPFEPGPLPVETVFFRCNPKHHCLAVAKVGSDGPAQGLAHFMIEMASLDDVGRAFDRAVAAGCAITTLGRHSNDHMLSFYLDGPGGIAIECGFGGREVDEPHWEIARFDAPSLWGHKPLTALAPAPKP